MDERVYEIRGAPRHGGDAFLVLLVSTVAVLLVLIAYGRASGERDAEILEAMVQDAVMADKLALAGPGRSGPVEREWDLESVTGLRERAEVVIDADRGGRAAVVRASAVLILADQLESGAELAERAGAGPLARAVRNPPTTETELHEAVALQELSGWLATRLAATLARHGTRHGGDEELKDRAEAREQDLMARTSRVVLVATGLLGAAVLAGLVLLLGGILRYVSRRFMMSAPLSPFEGGVRAAVAVMCLWFLGFVAVGVTLAIPGLLGRPLSLGSYVFMQGLLSGTLGLLLVRTIAPSRIPGRGLWAGLGLGERLAGPDLLRGFKVFLVALPVAFSASWLNRLPFDEPTLPPFVLDLMADPTPYAIFMTVMAVCVVAPLFEEALFRGYLFPVLRQRFGFGVAAVLSAGLFSIVHLDLDTLLPLWLLGILFAFVRHVSGATWGAVLCHALFNLLNLALMWAAFA